MKKSLILGLLVCFGGVSVSSAQIFTDSFDNGNVTTQDLNTSLGIRQSGSYVSQHGTVSWATATAGSAATLYYQNRQNQLQATLQSTPASRGPGRISTYLNQDFASTLGGTHYSINVDLALEVFSSGGNPATATITGATAYRLILGNSASAVTSSLVSDWGLAFNLSPYYNTTTGSWAVATRYVVGGVETNYGDINFTPVDVSGEWYTPSVTLSIDVNEITQTASLRYGATVLVADVDITGVLGGGRYVGLQAFIGNTSPTTTVLQHRLDNLSIVAVPEPSSFALLAGVLSCGALCCLRRRKGRA